MRVIPRTNWQKVASDKTCEVENFNMGEQARGTTPPPRGRSHERRNPAKPRRTSISPAPHHSTKTRKSPSSGSHTHTPRTTLRSGSKAHGTRHAHTGAGSPRESPRGQHRNGAGVDAAAGADAPETFFQRSKEITNIDARLQALQDFLATAKKTQPDY